MNFTELRRSHFPYLIEEVEPGWHVVLNREHKPLGMIPQPGKSADYHEHMVKFRGLGPAKAMRLSFNGSDSTKNIVLYNDGCIPTHGTEHEKAYFERLSILYKLKVDYDAVRPESKSSCRGQVAVEKGPDSLPAEVKESTCKKSQSIRNKLQAQATNALVRLQRFFLK